MLLVVLLHILAFGVITNPLRADPSASQAEQLSVDSPMGALLDNPVARKVIQEQLPALLSSAQIEQARGLSLRALQQLALTRSEPDRDDRFFSWRTPDSNGVDTIRFRQL